MLPNVNIDQEVDDTIGSYFIGLSNMQEYYRKFKSGSLERKILWGYKCINFLRKKSKGDKDLIKEYSIHHLGVMFKENHKDLLEAEWESAYHKLEEIGFLYVKDRVGRIEMEEIYLEKIVLNKEIKSNRGNSKLSDNDKKFNEERILCNDILKTYQFHEEEERRKTFTRLLSRIGKENRKLKEDLYNQMTISEEIKPDEFTLNVLIRQEENIEDCEELFEKLVSEGTPYNNHTLNLLIKKSPSFPYAYNKFKQFKINNKVEINEFTLRVLCYKADNFFQTWELYREFNEIGIYPTTPYFYYNLLKKADSFKEAYDLYLEVERVELKPRPNAEFYNRVIQKEGGEYSLAWDLYKTLVKDFGEGNIEEYTIISLIKKAPNYEEAQKIFEMVDALDNIKLMPTFFTNLIKRAPSFETAEKIFKDLESREILINKEPYNTLMGKAPDFDTAIEIEQKMIEEGIALDGVTLLNLVKKAETYEIAWNTLLRFSEEEKQVIPTLGVFNAILNKLNSDFDKEERSEKCLEIYHVILGLGLIETRIKEETKGSIKNTFDLLVRKFNGLNKKLEIIELAYKVGIPFQGKKFHGAIQRCTTYEDITKVCKTMLAVEVTPSLESGFEMLEIILKESNYKADKIIDFLLYLKDDLKIEVEIVAKLFELFLQTCQSKEDAEEVYLQIIHDDVLITPQAYINLIWIYLENSPNKQLAPIVEELELEVIKDENIPPEYFEGFLKRCTDYSVAIQIYQEMYRWEITPNTKTFEILLDVLIESNSFATKDKVQKINQLLIDALEVEQTIPANLFDYLVKLRLSWKISDPNLRQVFNTMIANDIAPSDFALEKIAWFNSSRGQEGFEQINSSLKKFDAGYVIPYNVFIKKCFRLNDAKKLYNRMIGEGIKPTAKTFENMLWFVSNHTEFKEVFALMREYPIAYSMNLTILLIKNSQTDTEAFEYFEAFAQGGGDQNDPNADSYVQYCLVDKLQSFSSAWKQYLKYYRVYKRYNPLFFHTLSKKKKTPFEAKKLSKEILKSGIKPPETLLDNIMTDYSDEKVWDLIRDYSYIKVKESASVYHQLFQLRERKGLTTKAFSSLLKKNISFQSALNILRLMKAKNISLNEYSFIKVCEKGSTKEEINQIIFLAKANNISVGSSGFFAAIIDKTDDLDKILEVYNLMEEKGLKGSINSYCKTINNIEKFSDSWEFFKWMKAGNKFPFKNSESNKRVLKALAKKSTHISEIEEVYNETLALNIIPSPEVYRAIISRTSNEAKVLAYLEELLNYGVTAGIKIKKALFEKKRSFQFDWNAFLLIIKHKGNVRDFRINLFVDKANNYEDIEKLYNEMIKTAHKPTYKVYRKMMSYTNTFEDALDIYKKILANKFKVTDDIFRNFMSTATNYKEVKLILDYNRQSGFPYSIYSLRKAMTLVGSFKNAIEIHQMAVNFNYKLTSSFFDNFIAAATTFKEAEIVLNYISESGLPYTTFALEKVMFLAENFEDASDAYQKMINQEVIVSNILFEHFIATASTFEEAMQILELMLKSSSRSTLQLSENICNSILILPGGKYNTSKPIFDFMKQRNYILRSEAAKRLIERSVETSDIKTIFLYFFECQNFNKIDIEILSLLLEKQMTFEDIVDYFNFLKK